MARKKRKKYSIRQKSDYHEKRVYDSTLSENKRIYSRNWLEGLDDYFAKSNLEACNSEIKKRRKAGVKVNSYDIGLYGYRNGLKARLIMLDNLRKDK